VHLTYAQGLSTKNIAMNEQGIRELEERLKQAMTKSDVAALDTLLADDLTFVDATGKVWSKSDDLNGHRYGMQRIDRLDVEEQSIRAYGTFAVTVTRVAISGTFAGAPFAGSLRYTRTWGEVGGAWKVVAAQCGLVAF
jgi:ketosteroid isomerase-like protein